MHVGFVTQPQHASLVDLLCELHSHYHHGSSVSRELVRVYLVGQLLATDSPLRLLVAVDEPGNVVGLAAVSLTYSLVEPAPGTRRQCWLKELYVRSSSRNLGVGTALMSRVARYAVEQGCARIDWPVTSGNARGIAFYEGLGAVRVADRLGYRLSGPGLQRLAGNDGSPHV